MDDLVHRLVGHLVSPFLVIHDPPTETAKILAVAVLKGDNAGPALVDELIAHDNIDVGGEFAKKVRRETLAQVEAVIDKLVHDESVSRMGVSQREWFSAGYRMEGLLHIRQLISELA